MQRVMSTLLITLIIEFERSQQVESSALWLVLGHEATLEMVELLQQLH